MTKTNLITGFLGSGKTTTIRHLLAHKPDQERWAVLSQRIRRDRHRRRAAGGQRRGAQRDPRRLHVLR